MIVEKELFMTKLNETRKIFIYLHDDYDTSNKQYPVLYAFDGHNIFLDAYATYGKAIHIQQHIEKLGIDMIVAPRKIGFIFWISIFIRSMAPHHVKNNKSRMSAIDNRYMIQQGLVIISGTHSFSRTAIDKHLVICCSGHF